MKYTIKKAVNGWTIEREVEGEVETDVLVGVEDEMNETKAFITFLYDIVDNFGPTSGRYSEERIRVVRVPGDKYEGPLDLEYLEELTMIRDYINATLENTKRDVNITKPD